ncbi:hypothetical protein U0070_003020 [Myodes glareolus]|uniref:Uncharacterized protein n=1 Tax=Myodes glareolus TaxID=447135 RepID=A0AAW0HSQ6_MYOGA
MYYIYYIYKHIRIAECLLCGNRQHSERQKHRSAFLQLIPRLLQSEDILEGALQQAGMLPFSSMVLTPDFQVANGFLFSRQRGRKKKKASLNDGFELPFTYVQMHFEERYLSRIL